jgi:hypothetical protein
MKNRQAKLIKLESTKPRNPLVVLAAQRKAGSHRKSGKALRRAERIADQQKIRTGAGHGDDG